jgi:hypothetical protein
MYILDVFWPMLNDLTHRNASMRQVYGIRNWQDYVRRTVQAAPDDATRDCLDVPFSGSASHRTWRVACWGILNALSMQAGEAQVRKAEADAEAVSRDRAAEQADADAAAARSAAAAFRAQAAQSRAAAAGADPDLADRAGTDAMIADGNAAAAEAAAAEHAVTALKHRENAAEARVVSRRCQEWDIAASDAGAFGKRVLANEEPIARRVGEGIAAAGGLPEVPADKRYADQSVA